MVLENVSLDARTAPLSAMDAKIMTVMMPLATAPYLTAPDAPQSIVLMENGQPGLPVELPAEIQPKLEPVESTELLLMVVKNVVDLSTILNPAMSVVVQLTVWRALGLLGLKLIVLSVEPNDRLETET